MKATILVITMILASAAQAESAWWQAGDLKSERYEHKFDEQKSKRHNGARAHKEKSDRHHKPAAQKQFKIADDRGRHHHKDRRYSDRGALDRPDRHHDRSRDHHRPPNYKDGYRDDHRHHQQHDYKPRRWQAVSAFRGRTGKDVTRYIGVEDRVQALSIAGTKRAMYIRRAYALMGNGKWIRIQGLEGYVSRGETVRHRLRHPRYVRQIALDIEPARYKRGYAELRVRPA